MEECRNAQEWNSKEGERTEQAGSSGANIRSHSSLEGRRGNEKRMPAAKPPDGRKDKLNSEARSARSRGTRRKRKLCESVENKIPSNKKGKHSTGTPTVESTSTCCLLT